MNNKKVFGWVLAAIVVVGLAVALVTMQSKSRTQGVPAVQPEGWQLVSAEQYKLTASLPSPVTEQSESAIGPDGKPIAQHTYIGNHPDGTRYMLTVSTFSQGIPADKPEAVIETVISGMVGADKRNKLVSSEVSVASGLPARDIVIRNDALGISYLGRIFYKNNMLYQLLVAQTKPASEADVNHFLTSVVVR
jgi:hypothetical protein